LSSNIPIKVLKTIKALTFTFLLLFALIPVGAQTKATLAILPFTGAQSEDGEAIAELFSFQRDLTAVFNPVPRASINRAIRGEQGFQMESGMTDPDTIASLGKQLGATYVVAGTITTLGSQNLLVIAILHTETLRQIAGDIQTYRTIEEIDGKLPAMARNITAAVQRDTSKLPLLALPPMQLAGGIDSREADAMAQVLAMYLIRSGKYAVYPRTKSLEQVQEEYGNQFNRDTADKYLPDIGRTGNPRLALSVTAHRLGTRNIFNAAIINLETGVQEAGDTVNYQSPNDGVGAMDDLARKMTGRETREAEAARLRAEQEAVAARLRAEQEAAARARAEVARHNPIVRDAASFTQAITTINNDWTANSVYTVTLNGDFAINPITFTGNATKTITIKGDANARTISNREGVGYLFTVPKGITLVLENNVTLSKGGVRVDGGTFTMSGGTISRHGVFVSGGTFTMSGGIISRNSNSNYYGSGVRVDGGTFTMSNGIISGYSAGDGGGVRVSGGTFTMLGGAISGNSASRSSWGDGYGGGVFVSGGTFTMSGGTISENSTYRDGGSNSRGGGVYVSSGTFTMSGGTISKNSARGGGSSSGGDGGGVYVRGSSGTFTMSGGTISGNSAFWGGGVFVVDGTFIKKDGGTIDNTNTAYSDGYGRVVFVYDGSKRRNATAGPSVNLDSRASGSAGGWE
jgi:hypothetical protein